MIQRYYFDTSIFGGFFDPEFSKETKQIFNLVLDGKIVVTPECLELAAQYIKHKVVGYTSLDDCIHIATATLYSVDALLS